MKTTSIQHKILQFRKDKMLAGKSGDGLVYRVSKDEAIEVAEFLSKLCPKVMNVNIAPGFCIHVANGGEFKPLHDLILNMGTLFGVEIHPDWQEHTNKNMHY